MSAKKPQSVALYFLLALLIPLSIWLHARMASQIQRISANQAVFVPSAQAVRLVSLGYDQLMADFYWLAFVSYVGNGSARALDHSQLADQYLDLITGLDPKFVQPYWFCAFTVGSEQERPLRANAIIQRGIRTNPDNWFLPYIAGINLFLFAHDEVGASKYYRVASRLPYAPPWLSRQAEILAARIPSTLKEIRIWEAIYAVDEAPMIRSRAKSKLVELWSKVYSTSPQGPIRKKAQDSLQRLKDS